MHYEGTFYDGCHLSDRMNHLQDIRASKREVDNFPLKTFEERWNLILDKYKDFYNED